MKWIWILLVAALALGSAVLLMPRAHHAASSAATFDAFLRQTREEAALPGIAVVIVRDGEIAHASGHGFADVETGRPMTPDTPMNLASISKPVLGIAVLRLRDENKLSLDADINEYLPFAVRNPNAPDTPISMRMLATHTSSIADFYAPDEFTPGEDSSTELGDYLQDLLSPNGARYDDGAHYLNAAPGSTREYSNLGAAVAGAAIEATAGEPLAEYQQRTLFTPLGMSHTSWRIADFAQGELANRYRVRQCIPWINLCTDTERPIWNEIIGRLFDPPARFKHVEPYGQLGEPTYPDGGLNASANDLATLMLAIMNNGAVGEYQMLSPQSFEDMFQLQAPALDDRQRFFWRDRDGLTGHAGSDRGVFTYMYFDRTQRNGFIVLINRTPDSGTERTMDAIIARIRSDFFKQ